MFAVVELKDNN